METVRCLHRHERRRSRERPRRRRDLKSPSPTIALPKHLVHTPLPGIPVRSFPRICGRQESSLNSPGPVRRPMHLWSTKGVLACESSLTPAECQDVSVLVSVCLTWSWMHSLERIGTTRIWDMLAMARPKMKLRRRSLLVEPTTRSR
jgi:hypothetical protein